MRGAVAAATLLLGSLSSNAALGAAALPQIAAVPVEGGVRLEASVLGLGAGEVTAMFEIEREENGNRMRTSQSMTFAVAVGDRHMVAHTTMSLDTSARLNARLRLEGDGRALGTAQLTLGAEEK